MFGKNKDNEIYAEFKIYRVNAWYLGIDSV